MEEAVRVSKNILFCFFLFAADGIKVICNSSKFFYEVYHSLYHSSAVFVHVQSAFLFAALDLHEK